MSKKAIQHLLKNIFVWLLSLSMFVPFLLVLINSLKDQSQAGSMGIELPTSFHWENYSVVIEKGKLLHSFFNSMLYASVSSLLSVILSALAAYVLSRNRTKFNKFIYFFIILGIAMPINFVTLTKVMQLTHLMNTQIGIIILYAVMAIPFSLFLMYGFVSSVPRELDEAGIMDGCKPLRLFYSIVLPLLKPVVITVVILNFMNSWNDFVMALYYLNSSTKWPMTLAVYNFFGQFQVSWNLVSADIVLTTLPVLVIYLLGQRYIIAGMTAGSVKG